MGEHRIIESMSGMRINGLLRSCINGVLIITILVFSYLKTFLNVMK